MAVVVTHATTAVGTDNGNGEIGKSEWNANHTVAGLGTMAEATAADYSTTAQIAAAYQPLDSDLTTIAGLTATTNNIIQSVSSAWASRTPTQVTATLIDMVGDSGAGGTKGLVPAPASGDAAAGKFLKADGVWTAVSASPGGSDTQIQFNDSSAFGGDAGLVFNKTTNALTGTGLWTVTQATANTGIFASTGYSLTGSDATGMINLAGTWNTSGNPVALQIAITNTASGATSKFLSLLAGGAGATEIAYITKGGAFVSTTASYDSNSANYGQFGKGTWNGDCFVGGFWYIEANAGAYTGPTMALGWSSSGPTGIASTQDTKLYRDGAANTIAQRNGTSAQVKRIYDTYASSTDYHRLAIATARATLSGVTGASVTATAIIPDGAVVVGVTTKVTTGLGTGSGTTGYTVGDGSDVDRWGVVVGTASGTSSDNTNWTATTIQAFTAASDIVITASGGNFDGTGVIYVSVQYLIGQCD
jgi:hypothetical protein